MKILHTVESYYPSIGGMQEVVKQLSEYLVTCGHEVIVATSKLNTRDKHKINGVTIVEFQISGNTVRGMSGEVKKYEQFLLELNFDIITNFAAQQWATDIMLRIIDKIKAKKVFVPTGFSRLYDPQYKNYFQSMNTVLKKYDMNVFQSDTYQDIMFARNCGVTNITIIPNGAAEDEFKNTEPNSIRAKLNIPNDNFLILNVSAHTGAKGHSQSIKIFDRASIRKATFLMVAHKTNGGCVKKCKNKKWFFNLSPRRIYDAKRMLMLPLSRRDTIAAYKEADLFLFTSSIECSPLVLFECLASKTPFLSTDVGNAAEIVEWTNAGIILPTSKNSSAYSEAEVQASADLLGKVVNDSHKRKSMAMAGYKSWHERFTWEKISAEYEKMYKNLNGQ